MRWTISLLLLPAIAATLPAQEPGHTEFRAAGEGLFTFDTGSLRGRLRLDGKFQGIYPIVDPATESDLTRPPGVFSPYRVFSTGRRYGDAARDWPAASRLREDGAVVVRWPSAKGHPVAITGVYRLAGPETIDLEIAVVPAQDMPGFELFVSSYFAEEFRAAVYLEPNTDPKAKPRFVPVDRTPEARGGYVMFPRDEKAVKMIRDGRWKVPPSPVDWDVEKRLAAPLILRRDAKGGITAVLMARPEDCFAVSSPWNPAAPEAGGYRSLYLSLFGRDLAAGEKARARCRMVIGRGLTDEKAVALYEAYSAE